MRLAFYTDAVVYGGAEHSLANLLSVLDERFDATLIAIDADVAGRIAAQRPSVRVVLLPPVASKRDLAPIAAHVRALGAAAPGIVQLNLRTPWSCQYGLLGAALAPRARIVAVQHSPIPASTTLQRLLRGAVNRRVAMHVAVSDGAARLVADGYGIDSGDVRVIRNGAPEPEGVALPRVAPGPVVACVGRLSPEKGVDVLLRALAELPGVTAVLLGDGPERRSLETLAAELGVTERVHFAGWVENPGAYLRGVELLVLPSRYEALPIAVTEAMLAALPVVASDVGSVAEAVVHEQTGLLVAPDDPAGLAVAVRTLLGDPDRRAAMGHAGHELAQRNYSLRAMASAYEELYRELGIV